MFIERQHAAVYLFFSGPAALRSRAAEKQNKIDLCGVWFYKHVTPMGFQSGRSPNHGSWKNLRCSRHITGRFGRSNYFATVALLTSSSLLPLPFRFESLQGSYGPYFQRYVARRYSPEPSRPV